MPRVWILDAGQGVGTLRAQTSLPLRILMAVVGGILLIACANIAGLLLARGAARQKEIATRLAVGASRIRLVRQLRPIPATPPVTDSRTLSVTLAYALGRFAPSLLSQLLPTVYGANRSLGVGVTPDLRVLAFSVALAVVTGVVFGLMPAFRATRIDLLSMMKQAASASPQRRFRITSGQTMVTVQTMLAMLLLIGAGLFIRTVVNLRGAALGYEPERVLYVRVEPWTGGIPPNRRAQFFEDAVRHLETTPGVAAASAVVQPLLADAVGVGLGGLLTACTSEFNPPDGNEP